MTTKRIIAKIDIKGKKVIKGKRFEGLRIIEDLDQFISKRDDDLIADELYINNITGSLYDTHIDLDLLQLICRNIHIPITVQGGINSIEEIENLLEKGACRVALNTAILQNKIPIETLFREFGSQAIVFSPSIRVASNGDINFYINAGRELIKPPGNLSAYDYISNLSQKGLIEVLIRLIDFDGVDQKVNEITLSKLKNISKINIDTIISGSMHINYNYENVFNSGFQGIALSQYYIFKYKEIQNIRNEISKKWEVRK